MITLTLALVTLLPFDDGLAASEPVVCRKVVGFRDYEERDSHDLTKDEKLIIYYEPSGHTVERDPKTDDYHSHLIEDAQIRRKGNDKPIKREKAFLEYKPRGKEPLGLTYLSSSFSLKDLRPGEYEVDLILRDGLDDTKDSLMLTVAFKVIESPPDPKPD